MRTCQLIILGITSALVALALQVFLTILGQLLGLESLLMISYDSQGIDLVTTFLLGALSEEIVRVVIIGLFILLVLGRARNTQDRPTTIFGRVHDPDHLHTLPILTFGLIFGLAFGLTEVALFLAKQDFFLQELTSIPVLSLLGIICLHTTLSIFAFWMISRAPASDWLKTAIWALTISWAAHIGYNVMIYLMHA